MGMDKLVTVDDLIMEYFRAIDSALEVLSAKHERHVANLPPWTLCNREIRLAHVHTSSMVVIKAIPKDDLMRDIAVHLDVQDKSDLSKIMEGWQFSGSKPAKNFYFPLAGVNVTIRGHELFHPIHSDRGD